MSSKPPFRSNTHFVNQIIAAIIQNRPFDAQIATLNSTPPHLNHKLTNESVTEVLRSIPRIFFQSTRSIGRQTGTRHRTPVKQRDLRQESAKFQKGALLLGPAAYRDPEKVKLGLNRALDFFNWVESRLGFVHKESTCREMAIILVKANRFKILWDFLKEMSRRGDSKLVTTSTVTCLIKVLGEEGLGNEALSAFYRMKQFHCKPDVYAYNTTIYALCRVGNFKKAKILLAQMELPGFRCQADTFTYTIMISSYCKHGMQTGCKKAIRRRIWEANHMFRLMLFKGFVPDVVTYNCLIDGCCKTNRIERAVELFDDMLKRGCAPNRITYNSFIRYYSVVNEIDKAIEMLRTMAKSKHGLPTTSSYTPIIHALCESESVKEARDFLVELVQGGSIPREYTYKLVLDKLESIGEIHLLSNDLRMQVENGIENRHKGVMKVKPIMKQRTTS